MLLGYFSIIPYKSHNTSFHCLLSSGCTIFVAVSSNVRSSAHRLNRPCRIIGYSAPNSTNSFHYQTECFAISSCTIIALGNWARKNFAPAAGAKVWRSNLRTYKAKVDSHFYPDSGLPVGALPQQDHQPYTRLQFAPVPAGAKHLENSHTFYLRPARPHPF